MPLYHCQRCGCEVSIPNDLPKVKRDIAVSMVRQGKRIEAAIALKNAGLPLAESKAIAFHITAQSGVCHRCRTKLERKGAVDCGKCKSLNLDW
jgi:hypothetical protein